MGYKYGASGEFEGLAVLESHSQCHSDGQTGCITSPSFAAALTQGLKDKVLAGQTVAGITGTVSLPKEEDVEVGITYGVANSLSGSFDVPNPSHVAQGVGFGNGGTELIGTAIIESHVDCNNDGQTGCLTTEIYPAALSTGLADKILSGSTVAGEPGNVTLPEVSHVKPGITFGIGGDSLTGNLTECSTDLEVGCLTTSVFQSANVSSLNDFEIKSGVSILGTSGVFTGFPEAPEVPPPTVFPDKVNLSWSDLSPKGVIGYLVVRRASSQVDFSPVDGQTYASGDQSGDHDILFVGNQVSFSDTGVTIGTTYHYRIYSFNAEKTYSIIDNSVDGTPQIGYQRWRIAIESLASSSYPCFGEVQFSIGGGPFLDNAATSHTEGSVAGIDIISISSRTVYSDWYPAWGAFESRTQESGSGSTWCGNYSQFSGSNLDGFEWLEVEFSSQLNITGFRYTSWSGTSDFYCPDHQYMQYYNGSDWITIPESIALSYTMCSDQYIEVRW